MRKNNRISEIDSSPFPHVVVEDFLDEDTLELVIDALAGLEYSLWWKSNFIRIQRRRFPTTRS